MSDLLVVQDSCPRCGTALAETSNFCSHCGLPMAVEDYPNVPAELVKSDASPVPAPVPATTLSITSSVAKVLENRLLVIAILLCAGPMGLPALWFSPRFSPRTKTLGTIAYLFVTAILPLAVAWYFLDVAVRPVVDVLRQAR